MNRKTYLDEHGRRLTCVECGGASRYHYPDGTPLEGDCWTCGGTGWQPPERESDARCTDCSRPLWLGRLGPRWFTLTGGPIDEKSEPTCSLCLKAREFRRRHPEFSEPDPNEVSIDDYKPGRVD